ncbi:hypothetical protein [Chryseosolibacter indicus]|uniref:hypothetical protein n=1 Tax=Chryseosolibacter indicus TaxID=2782351 RepID=UPI0020B1D98F|nr:hypothetical protein [Chryseosolibacter indicus]
MKVIGHDQISCNLTTILFKMLEPLINSMITITFLEQWQPFITGDCTEVDLVSFVMLLV